MPIEQEAIKHAISIAFNKIASRTTEKLLDGIELWASQKHQEYASYISSRLKTIRTYRSIISSTDYYDIETHYVDQFLRYNNRVCSEQWIRQSIGRFSLHDIKKEDDFQQNMILLQGGPGSGKSLFLRKLFLHICGQIIDRVPVFIELRDHQGKNIDNISELLHSELSHFCDEEINNSHIRKGLNAGAFTILIDGIDEFDGLDASGLGRDIRNFSARYPDCIIILTSRPMGFNYSLRDCEKLSLEPFSRKQANQLIDYIEYDIDAKQHFLKEIDQELAQNGMENIRTPLMLLIMLMTFDETGSLITKKAEFFEDSFSVLWNKHDQRNKIGYKRELKSKLSRFEFFQFVSMLAAHLYSEGQYNFDSRCLDKVIEYIESKLLFQVKSEYFKTDLCTTVGLLIEDGNHYEFIHKQFQEYFTAKYIVTLSDELYRKALLSIDNKSEKKEIILFLYQIDIVKFEFWLAHYKLKDLLLKFKDLFDLRILFDNLVKESDIIDVICELYDTPAIKDENRRLISLGRERSREPIGKQLSIFGEVQILVQELEELRETIFNRVNNNTSKKGDWI